jgi:hypothetical protein
MMIAIIKESVQSEFDATISAQTSTTVDNAFTAPNTLRIQRWSRPRHASVTRFLLMGLACVMMLHSFETG